MSKLIFPFQGTCIKIFMHLLCTVNCRWWWCLIYIFAPTCWPFSALVSYMVIHYFLKMGPIFVGSIYAEKKHLILFLLMIKFIRFCKLYYNKKHNNQVTLTLLVEGLRLTLYIASLGSVKFLVSDQHHLCVR